MSRGRKLPALLLVVLFTAGSFLALAPTATSQEAPTTPPVICFDPCNQPPHYPQGASVDVRINGFVGAQTFMSARCVQGCPSQDPSATNVYWTIYRGGTVRFPRDFVDPGPDATKPGGNAVFDQAPRYNSTWEVTAHLPGAPIARQFFVWLYDAYVGTNLTVRPGESHMLRATGFEPGAEITYRWEKRDPVSGRYEPFIARVGRASSGATPGIFEDQFSLPPSAASEVAACSDPHTCYRIILSGTGKQDETVYVQVGPAQITRSTDTTPRPAQGTLPTLQRTQNASFDIDLYYPGGRVRHGPKLTPDAVPESFTYGGRILRVAVEKFYTGNDTVYLLAEAPLRFDASRFLWNVKWTIPKDIPIEDASTRYRLRLVAQNDAYGNRVVEDILGNFTIDEARLIPTVLRFDRQLERTEEGILRLAVLYHNGTPFSRNDTIEGNTSPLRGCYVRTPPPPPQPAPPAQPQVERCNPGDTLTWGTYYGGAWNFTVRYPRDYANLDDHRFFLVPDVEDRWGNSIAGFASENFRVVPARPEVQFSTVTRGRDAEVFERGDRIFVTATITYHDGSPYNHRVRENPNSTHATIINGTLLRRGPSPTGTGYGPLAGEERFVLTESDPNAGRWNGHLQLSDDDTSTPAGIWTFRFDIRDNLTVPNVNLTSFDREIVSSTIQVCPTFQPPNRAATSTSIKFRFKLVYSECDSGRDVPASALEGKIAARVYRYDAQARTTVGDPVSNILVPFFAKDTTFDWGLEYEIPHTLFAGTYVLSLTGADTFGNKIVPNSVSRPFSTYTDVLERGVLTQPGTEVRRGDSATVVFDAREGDTSVDPSRPAPRIQLERFDTSTTACPDGAAQRGCWVREIGDVRVDDPSYADHVGVFPVGIDTPVGVYRFSLQGRDARFNIITALSSTFIVNPTQVVRALDTLPPDRIVKGQAFTFYLDQQPGDVLRDRVLFHNGRVLSMPLPQLTSENGRVNVTWAIPFDAPTGNYTMRISGRDVNGNNILIITPPIEAVAATLEGRLLGQPTRAVERGGVARLNFAVAYPDGGFYVAADTPRVFVRTVNGIVSAAEVRREGLSFAAFWSPGENTPLGEYFFEVSPQSTGGTGNEFTALRSNTFRVIPGEFNRNPIDDAPAEVERLSSINYNVPFEADDKFAGFELVYYGPSLSSAISSEVPLVEVTRTPLPHTIDAQGGRYVARLVTDHQSQVGLFRIAMTGEDAHGNRIVSQSRPFTIIPTTIGITFDRFPSQSEFGEGKTITISFVAKYRIGTIMDASYGAPSVVALFNERPITQRPEIQYLDGHWYMSWTAPDVLPDGDYQFAIGGTDLMGNPIASARSTPYPIATTAGESFAKAIPAPSPLLALLLLAAVAIVVRLRAKA